MEHNSTGNSALVLDLVAFHLLKKNFHGSSRLVCSVLKGYFLA